MSDKNRSDLPSTETISVHKCEESPDNKPEFSEQDCSTDHSNLMTAPNVNSEDSSTHNVKKEFNEEVCATPSSPKVSSPEDISTLDFKVQFTEQDTMKEFNEEVCATPSSPKVTSPEDISTLDVKVEFTEQDTVKEFNEEVCATPSSPKVSSPENISTLDVKEFTEQDTVSLEEISTPIVCDTPFEVSTTFKLKEESTKNNSMTVSTPIIYLSGHPREDICNFRDKVQLADQDWSTVPLTAAISTPDVIKESICNDEDECREENDAPSTRTIHCPDSVQDSETQENWSSVPTDFLPDTIREDNCTHNVQIELDKEVSVTASNPLISDPDKSKERREFTEQECSMVLSNSADTLTTGKDISKTNVKNVCSKKCCTSSVLPPIIFLPDNLHEDIRKLISNIEFADQDWSRVPSKPKLSLLENIPGITESAKSMQKTNQLMTQKLTNKVAHCVVPSNPKISLKKFSPTAMFQISLPRKKHVYQVSTATSSINQTKVIPHAKFATPSNVPSNPKIFHGHSDVSGIAADTTSNQLLPQPTSRQPQGTTFSAPKQSVSIQNKKLSKKKKLSNSVRRRKSKLLAHGVPEEIASDLCLLQIPELLEKIPSLKAVFQSAKQESHTTAINTSKSTDKFICMEPALKIPDSRIEQPRNPKYTGRWRVGIQNLTPMDKEQMTMVHRRLVLAIANLNTYGGGPQFLNFKQMDGWILVTGVDQRSRAWLVNELQYLQLWPGAQLSIMSEQKIPEPTVAKIVAFIPESEATTVKEALDLLRAQNKGLNTEQWKLVDERIGIGKKWTVTFIIDEDSLETIRAQGSIGFTKMLVIPVEGINGSNSKPDSPEDISNCQDSSQKTPIPSPENYVLSGNSDRTNPVESQTQLQNGLQSTQCEGLEENPREPCSGNVNMKSDGPKKLYTRDRNRDRQVIENKRRIEEASMPGGEKRFKANRDRYIDKFGSEMRIANGLEGGVEPQQTTRDLMANTIGTDLGYFSIGSSVGGPGFDTRGTFIQNKSGTEDITLTQQNGVLAPAAGSVIGLSQTIVYMVPPSNQGNRATGGTNNFTATPQNNTIAAYSVPMVNMSITGEESNTVPPSNIVSDLTAAETDVQAMDYFLGPGGGSQFIRNQRFQNSFSHDAAEQTAQANLYPLNTSSNLVYNMNHHQVFQNEMSFENEDHGRINAGVQMSEGHGCQIRRNSSPTREDSEEGYKSWIIQDAEGFATSTIEHNTITDPETQLTQMGEDHNEDGPSSAQNTNARTHLDRLYHQAGDNGDHGFGRRSYDDGSSKPDGRSSRASSWNMELADFEMSRKDISPRRHRILPEARHRFSDIDGRPREESDRLSWPDGSHVRSNSKDQVIEERMWSRRDRADRDRHLKSDNRDFYDSNRNRRAWPNDRERSYAGRRNIQDSASSHTRNTFIRDQRARDDVRNIRGFTREPRFAAHQVGVRRKDVLPRR